MKKLNLKLGGIKKMLRIVGYKTLFVLAFTVLFNLGLHAQNRFIHTPTELVLIKKLKAKVETKPENLDAHRAFIDAFMTDMDNPALEGQYKTWMDRFPKNYVVPFAIGKAYLDKKNVKAIPFLLQASILKPDKAEIWNLLSQFALFTNNVELQQKYLQKAINLDPANAEYAFYYAYSFKDTDPVRFDSLSLEVARRFPVSEYGDMALYWLASRSTIRAQKAAYFRQLYNRKVKPISSTYLDSMLGYFDLLLDTNPGQALELGLALILDGTRNRNLWYERIKVANSFLQAQKLLTQDQAKQALALLNKVDLGSSSRGNQIDAEETLALFKAEAADAANQTKVAYDSLAVLYSKIPSNRLNLALYKYGCKLGIDSSSVAGNIWKIRENRAKPATDFCLDNYLLGGKSGLSDYTGKVILLTYWFPACFSCQNQFSHFESVLKKFDSTKVVYVALNLEPNQNAFVLPYLKTSGYNFIPLQDDPKWKKGSLATNSASTNYLIDQKGRVIFSDFMINAENEKTLELMISEILNNSN